MANLDPKKALKDLRPPARRDKGFLQRTAQRLSKRESEEYSTLSVYIKRDTHRRFKGKAGMEGIDMSEAADILIRKWLQNEIKLDAS